MIHDIYSYIYYIIRKYNVEAQLFNIYNNNYK